MSLHKTARHALALAAATCVVGPTLASEAITAANNEISLSVGAQTVAYHEKGAVDPLYVNWMRADGQSPDGYLDSQMGTMPAFQVALSQQRTLFGVRNVYLSATVSAAVGSTNYGTWGWSKHYTQSQGTWETYGRIGEADHDFTVDGMLKVGKAFVVGKRAQITPYLAFGGHVWNRNVSWMNGDDYYWNLEAGVGVLAQYAVTDRFVIGADVAGLETIGAHAHENGLDYPLGSRPMLAASIMADYRLTKHLHLKASYGFQRFLYGASSAEGAEYGAGVPGDPIYRSMEPASETMTQVVLVGLAYAF